MQEWGVSKAFGREGEGEGGTGLKSGDSDES